MAAAARPAGPPAQRRVSRDGAAGGVRGQRRSARAAWTSATSASSPHVLAIVAGTWVDFPQRRRTYHNVFSLSKTKDFNLGRYAAGQVQGGPLRAPGHRPRLLRDSFAHERVHPRLRAPLLRGDRRRGTLPARRRAARHLHGGGLERDRARRSAARGPSRSARPAATSTQTSASDEPPSPRSPTGSSSPRRCWPCCRSASRSTSSIAP